MASVKGPQTNSSREKLAQAYHLAGEAATQTSGNLKARASSSLHNSKQRATNLEKKAETAIKEHPVLSVGCAFAAGWVIAKLFRK